MIRLGIKPLEGTNVIKIRHFQKSATYIQTQLVSKKFPGTIIEKIYLQFLEEGHATLGAAAFALLQRGILVLAQFHLLFVQLVELGGLLRHFEHRNLGAQLPELVLEVFGFLQVLHPN